MSEAPFTGSLSGRRCRATALALGFLAASIWTLLAGLRIDAQGPQYDELHQATGAFTWLGSPPEKFCMAVVGRICILNMPYSAALKTNLYGFYLRFVTPRFSLVSWRMFGILIIAAGIVLFCAAAWPALRPGPLAVFLALLVTDGAVLLAGRFDWGPVAIALVLRLVLLGLWLRGEAAAGEPSPRGTAALGGLVGFAAFEMLSSVVLVPALAALLLGSARRRSRRHLLAAAAGLATGALPLAAVNLGWLLVSGRLVWRRRRRCGPSTASSSPRPSTWPWDREGLSGRSCWVSRGGRGPRSWSAGSSSLSPSAS